MMLIEKYARIIIIRQFKKLEQSRQVSQLKFKIFLTLFISLTPCVETTTKQKVFLKAKAGFSFMVLLEAYGMPLRKLKTCCKTS